MLTFGFGRISQKKIGPNGFDKIAKFGFLTLLSGVILQMQLIHSVLRPHQFPFNTLRAIYRNHPRQVPVIDGKSLSGLVRRMHDNRPTVIGYAGT